MGDDPNNTGFPPGIHCAAFEAFFDLTETPERILITVSGLVKCPLGTQDPFPGSIILTQNLLVGPCTWQDTDPALFGLLTWGALPRLSLTVGGGLGSRQFRGNGATDHWLNENVCGGTPFIQYHDGEAFMSWGPDI